MKILAYQPCEYQPEVVAIWEVDFIDGKFQEESFGAIGFSPEETSCRHGNDKTNHLNETNCEHLQRAKDLKETAERNPDINGVVFVTQDIPFKVKEVSTLEEILAIKETCFLRMSKELNTYFPKFVSDSRK